MTALTDWLDAAKSRADAATEGPWEVDHSPGDESVWGPELIVIGNYTANDGYDSAAWEDGTPADREFIAAARTDLPKALDALRAVLALIDGWHDRGPGSIRDYAGQDIQAAIATALGVAP